LKFGSIKVIIYNFSHACGDDSPVRPTERELRPSLNADLDAHIDAPEPTVLTGAIKSRPNPKALPEPMPWTSVCRKASGSVTRRRPLKRTERKRCPLSFSLSLLLK